MQWHLIQLKCGERGFLSSVQPEIPLFCVSQVVKVVQQMLRSLNPNPVGEESLRLYILLPELIIRLKKQHKTELTEALASKILQLDPDAHKVLGMEDLSAFDLCFWLCCICLSIVMLYSQRSSGPNSLMIGLKIWWSYFVEHLLSWLARFLVVNWIRIYNTWRCFWRPFRISIRWFFFLYTLDQICILIYHCIIVVSSLLWRSAAVLTETSQTGIWSFMRSMIY